MLQGKPAQAAFSSESGPQAGRSLVSITQDVLLVGVSAVFFWAHLSNAIEHASLPSALIAVEQGLLVAFFITRRSSRQTTTRPVDWLVALAGWLPLLIRPSGEASGAWEAGWVTVQVAGLAVHIWALAYLRRSFGVVAANRGVKVRGPYAFIRHPIYFSSLLTVGGFVALNPSPLNIGLFVATMIGQNFRLIAEERILGNDAEYVAYRDRVRWRLIPKAY